jgi:hypothetical protein
MVVILFHFKSRNLISKSNHLINFFFKVKFVFERKISPDISRVQRRCENFQIFRHKCNEQLFFLLISKLI